MPPYRYDPVQNPHALSIAETLARRGDIAAQRALSVAQAQSQAQQARGQVWGNAVQNIGQAVSGAVQNYAREKQEAPIRAQDARIRELQLQGAEEALVDRRREREDRSTMQSAMSSRMDPAQVKAQLQELGRGDLVPLYDKATTELEASRLSLKQLRDQTTRAEADYIGTIALNLKRANFDPLAVEWALAEAEQDGHDVARLRQLYQQQPDALKTLADQMIAKSPSAQKALADEAKQTFDAQREQREGIESMERIAATNRDDRRQSDALAEQARHNRAMEGREPAESGFQWAADPRDGKVRLMTPQEIRAIDANQAPTADMRNKEAGKKTAAIAVKAVRNIGAGIFTKVGPAQRAEAIKRGVEAVFGTDPEFRTYQDSRMALAGTLAVEQQGARVSDADVKALWLPMVPDAYRDTKESYELKWKLIDSMRGVESPDGPGAMTPNLSGLGEGKMRRFTSGPFAGQEWTIANGVATQVN